MSAQRYRHPLALERMEGGRCPECGEAPDAHVDDRFWLPRRCDLLPHGVTERIAQYVEDQRLLTGP